MRLSMFALFLLISAPGLAIAAIGAIYLRSALQ